MTSMKLGYFLVNSRCVQCRDHIRSHYCMRVSKSVYETVAHMDRQPARALADRLSIEFLLNTRLQSAATCSLLLVDRAQVQIF